MAITVKHATVAVGANANNGEIHREEWNENHPLTGNPGTSIEFGTGGDAEEILPAFAQLSDSTAQVPANTGPTLVTFNTQDAIENIIQSPGGGITLSTKGLYQLVAGAQIGKASGSAARYVDIWLRLNNVDIPNTAARQGITNLDTVVLLINYNNRFLANDNIKVYMAVSDITQGPGLYPQTNVGRPNIPSIILNVVKIR